MHQRISLKHLVATQIGLCMALAAVFRWPALRIVIVGGLTLVWLTGAPTASAADPACCAVTSIAKSGEITAKETKGARTFQFQVADPTLRRAVRVGAPVYANFDTKRVSLDGKKPCCKILNISTAAKQPVPNKTSAAPRSAAPTAPPAPPVSGRQTPAAPATATGPAAQTQIASGLIVTLEAVITDTTLRQSYAGVTGGLEDSAAVLLSGPARSVTYEQPRRGTREGPPVVLLTSSDPSVLRVPAGVAVPVGEREGKFTFITSAVSQPKDVTITATFNDGSKTGTVKVVPSRLLRIEMPASVRGGHVVQGSVVLNGPPANAASGTVKLASDNTQLVKVPNAVTVGTGQTQATFDVETFGVSQDKTVALVATLGEQGPRTASVKLLPPVLAKVDAGQSSSSWCVGPCTGNLRVVLDGKAPAGGLPLTLESELPVHIQATATVPAGGSEVSVPFRATQVSSNKSATLSASYGSSKKRFVFRVYRLEKHDLYVRRTSEIIDRFGNAVTTPPDSQPFQMCVKVAHKRILFHTSGYPSPTALGVTYRTGSTGRSFQVPVLWEYPVYVDNDDWDIRYVRICFDLPGIVDGGIMDVETIADVRKELDERNESNNDRSFKIAR